MKKMIILVLAVLCLTLSGAVFSEGATTPTSSTSTIPEVPISSDWGIDEGDSGDGY